MAEHTAFDFGKFVPGFDFLKTLGQTAAPSTQTAVPQVPGMANWIAPTLDVEAIDKRIQELKAVLFWLEQNSTALQTTIQALEVQKMTLSTLQGMNVSMAELSKAFTVKMPSAASPAADEAQIKTKTTEPKPSAAEPQPSAHPTVDPMQWWGSLTQQFQQLAASAMQNTAAQDVASQKALSSQGSKNKAAKVGKPTVQPAATAKPQTPRARSAAKRTR